MAGALPVLGVSSGNGCSVGAVFGGGSTQAAFGARGAATLLHKLTVGFFVLFMVTTLSIGIFQRSGKKASSVMVDVENPTTTELADEAAEVELLEAETPAVDDPLLEESSEDAAEEAPETP